MKDYPHACPKCGSPAYIGALEIDCSSCNSDLNYKVFRTDDEVEVHWWICKNKESLQSLVDSICGSGFFAEQASDGLDIKECNLKTDLTIVGEDGVAQTKTMKEWIETYAEEGLLASTCI